MLSAFNQSKLSLRSEKTCHRLRENICNTYIFDKGLASRIYKDLSKLSEKSKQYNSKIDKRSEDTSLKIYNGK